MPDIRSDIIEVCVFKNAGTEFRCLLLKRSDGDRLYPGIWQLVTGMIGRGEHAARAALREVREETGLSPVRMWRLPAVNSFYEPVHDVVHFCPNFAVQVAGNAEPALSPEHSAYEWCPADRARFLLPWAGQRAAVDSVRSLLTVDTEESALLEISLEDLERNPK